jgi:DNA-binding CsgD family transcriptional regulator
VVGHRDAAQRRPVRRQRGSIAWEPIPAWRAAGLADFQTPFADTCARSTAAAGPVGHPPSLHQLGLTPRDREALALVANGRSNRQIAEALFVRPKTAGAHVSNILAKLGVAGRVDRPPPRPRLRPARRRQPPDQATGWHNEILVMPLAQPGPPCVSPACWHAGLDELPARVAGRFARVEPRWHARAFVLALLVPLDHPGDARPRLPGGRSHDRPGPPANAIQADRVDLQRGQHLFAALLARPAADPAHRLRWSLWRRRQQARARTCHYRRQAAWQP